MNDAVAYPPKTFQIVRNGDPTIVDVDWSAGLANVQKGIADALNAKNIGFLLGAGCSSLRVGGKELGIATMQPLAKMFCEATLQALMHQQMLAELEAEGTGASEDNDELVVPTPSSNHGSFPRRRSNFLKDMELL